MLKIAYTNEEKIVAVFEGDVYELFFDRGETLCAVLVNGNEVDDYDEEIVDNIIGASM